jgi:hypothetical protein
MTSQKIWSQVTKSTIPEISDGGDDRNLRSLAEKQKNKLMTTVHYTEELHNKLNINLKIN